MGEVNRQRAPFASRAQRPGRSEPVGPAGPTEETLYAFLLGCKVDKGVDITHTSFMRPAGAFYVQSAHIDRFYRLYSEALARGADLHITEKHRHIGPVVVDLDFRLAVEPHLAGDSPTLQRDMRRYGERNVAAVVAAYCRAISALVECPPQFHVFVQEKLRPTVVPDSQVVKDGLHIVIPAIVTRPLVQQVLRRDVLGEVAEALSDVGLLNPIEEVVDEAVIARNNWFMYGSKKPGAEPYRVTRVYNYSVEAAGLSDVTEHVVPGMSDAELVELLSIRNKYDELPTLPARLEEVAVLERAEQEEAVQRDLRSKIVSDSTDERKNVTREGVDRISALVEILAPSRANDYASWIRVGWCLRNIDHRLLDAWIAFSKRSHKYTDGECDKLWNSMRSTGLGVGTLHMWAKADSPEAYREIVKKDLTGLIAMSAATQTHHDVARVVHAMFRHQYACASVRNKVWYEFRGHRWRQSDCAHTLRLRMSTEVMQLYATAADARRLDAAPTETEKVLRDEDERRLRGVAKQLKTKTFKDHVLSECSELFYHDRFEEKLDSTCSLIGFENGVFNLDVEEFREGRPDDYLSFSTGVSYAPFNPDAPEALALDTFWHSLFPNSAVRHYVLRIMSSALHGRVEAERFYVWTGSGCHARGTLIMMHDGATKAVEHVRVGDVLMGDDSKPRTVQELFRGRADMWRVVPVKGDPFVVNGEHVLSLKATETRITSKAGTGKYHARWMERSPDPSRFVEVRSKTFETRAHALQHLETESAENPGVIKGGDVVDVKVKDYLANVERVGSACFYLYRPDFVAFEAREVDPALHPYVLGAWLGDGDSRDPRFTSMDVPIVEKVRSLLPPGVEAFEGKQEPQELRSTGTRNTLLQALRTYGLSGAAKKHIPRAYRCNTREVRMQVLAGIIDTNGRYQSHANQLELTLKSECLIDDTISLARSLGFACYKSKIQKKCHDNGKVGTCFRIDIVGPGIEDIPVALDRKVARSRVKNKDARKVGFRIESVGDGDFYGFELDGNHRYLMADYVVCHNSNGKTKVVELFEKSFGDYCCKFPVSLLTQKRVASNAATSEIARGKGKRFAVLQEPSEDEKLNIGLMKEMTGGDKILTRKLYSEPIEFLPQWTLALLCNHLPNVPSDDGGTWRRIRVVEFESKFCDNPRGEKEFPIDRDLSRKFDAWKEPFIAMLIDMYCRNKKVPLVEPDEVKRCTLDYQRANDMLSDFVESLLVHTGSSDDAVPISEIYTLMTEWSKTENLYLKGIKRKDLYKYLEKNVVKPTTLDGALVMVGYRLSDRWRQR